MRRWSHLSALGAVALLVLAFSGSARANGTPIKIVMSYLSGVSNFGPQNATGVLEVVTDEGEVRLTATGLQQLPPGEQYQVWLANSSYSNRLALGAFRADAGGVAKLDLVRPPFPDKGWDLAVVTVEAAGSEPREPSNRRSIAGRFPAPSGAEGKPAQLPNTGADVPAGAPPARTTSPVILGALAAIALSGLVGFGLGRSAGRERAATTKEPR